MLRIIFTDIEKTNVLGVIIESRELRLHIIDATVADIFGLNETVVSECVSKVTVKSSADITTYYLFEDGSYGTNPGAGTRMRGKADTVYCENVADAEKAVGDVFAQRQIQPPDRSGNTVKLEALRHCQHAAV
jgi:hypothetical protein